MKSSLRDTKEGSENSSSFARRLATKWLGRKIVFFRELPSTQDEIKRHIFSEERGLVIWADRQTRGRGRLQRRWYSPRGAGLYFSLLLQEPPKRPPALSSFATAVATARALEEVLKIPFQLKWPNDILLRGRKVGGVLLEAIPPALIVGVGLNVSFKREDFPPEIRDKATSIYEETGLIVSRARLLRAILAELEKTYEALLTQGFQAIEADWRARDVTVESRVVLRRGDHVFTGYALGPAPDGTLLLKTADGIIRVHSGEILMWAVSGWEKHRAA